MKKEIILMIFVILLIPKSEALIINNIHEFMYRMDNNIPIVVGLNATSSDSIAATEIILGILQERNVILEVTTEDIVNPNINKLLIGHPCDNSLVKLSCEDWPYDQGEAIIKVIDGDLVIAGTTEDDTRRAAIVAANYKLFSILRVSKFVIVRGDSFDIGKIKVDVAKDLSDFACGDKICEPGEKFLCYVDCLSISCNDLCQSLNFNNAACRTTNPFAGRSSCKQGEEDKGPGYCSSGRSCCCSNKEIQPDQTIEQPEQAPSQEAPVQEQSGLSKFLSFILKPKTISWIVFIIIIGSLVYLAYYYLKPV